MFNCAKLRLKVVKFKNVNYTKLNDLLNDPLTTRIRDWNIIFDILESPPFSNIACVGSFLSHDDVMM